MPTDDPRLEQALLDAAPAVETAGVVERVTGRRRRRRRNRRLAAGVLALVVVLVVGAITVVSTGHDRSSPYVASPGAGFRARVIDGGGSVADGAGHVVRPKRAPLDQDARLLRPPLVMGATALSSASYDPGVEGIAPSHVVRIDGAHVVDVVDFKARILSIADGEGARWVLTQNHSPTGGIVPDVFLKRIPAAGAPTSTMLPTSSDPVGPIAAVGGAVWVPVRDGVVQYDTAGRFVRHLTLPDAGARWVAQVGKLASVTDGRTLRSLDAAGATGNPITFGPEILGLASANFDGRVLLANDQGGTARARVARATSAGPVQVTATLPNGFQPTGLAASTTRVWATGTVDGAPAIVLLDDTGVRATVVLENAGDEVALVWTGRRTVRAVAGGALYDIALP